MFFFYIIKFYDQLFSNKPKKMCQRKDKLLKYSGLSKQKMRQ